MLYILREVVKISLEDDAKKIIMDVYGPFSAAKVDAFASESPPDKNGKEFLDKCKGLVAKMFGEDKAQEKFAPLYAEVA